MIIYILNFCVFLLNSIFIEKYLHIFQLKDYQTYRYFKFFKLKFWFCIFALISFVVCVSLNKILLTVILNSVVVLFSIIFSLTLIKQSKTPINYTSKLKRMYFICILISFVCCMFIYGGLVANVLIIFLPPISNLLNVYDIIKNKKFIKSAQNKLQNSKAKIIAITGSNGKTSVKNILFEMLKTKYKVLVTPKSYNTPLGISKFLNENDLNVDFIILEYGARRVGDVKKLCSTFGADYGIITTVSPQHLESFKTIQNIYKTKKELSDFLAYKPCVFNADNIYTLQMFYAHSGKKIAVSTNSIATIYADEIKIEDYKTNFNLHINKNSFNATTVLLGEHNVLNICLAAALASELKISAKLMIEAIQNLTFTPHRLELIKTHIYILDDSYNCSLSSAREALKVLKSFAHKKMVVTPGIIEGGKNEYNLNFTLGKMLGFCDYVVIVGEHNKEAIFNGINATTNHAKIYVEKTLEQAKVHFKMLKKNDNLLLLNDLPDDYN